MPTYPWDKPTNKTEEKKTSNSAYPWEQTTETKKVETKSDVKPPSLLPKAVQPLLKLTPDDLKKEVKPLQVQKDNTKTVVTGKGEKKEVKVQGKLADKDLKRPDNPFAPALVNALNTASLGAFERNTDAIDDLREKAPISSTIGSMAGYITPFGLTKGALVKGGQTLGKRMLTDAAIGMGVDTATEIVKGKNDLKTAAGNVAMGAVFGIAADGALTILGKIGKELAKNFQIPKDLEVEIKREVGAFQIDAEGNVYKNGQLVRKLNKGGGGDVVSSDGTRYVDQFGNVKGEAQPTELLNATKGKPQPTNFKTMTKTISKPGSILTEMQPIENTINKVSVKKDKTIPRQYVQRIEEPGVSRANLDKPHGIYTTPSEYVSPHQLGGDTFYWEVNPNAKVLELEPFRIKSNRQSFPIETGTGIYSAAKFLGKDEVERLMAMGKKDLIEYLKQNYPGYQWERYASTDQQMMVEGLGGILAKQNGYDAVRTIDKDLPEFSEYVMLTENAGKPIDSIPNTNPTNIKPQPTITTMREKGIQPTQKIIPPSLKTESQTFKPKPLLKVPSQFAKETPFTVFKATEQPISAPKLPSNTNTPPIKNDVLKTNVDASKTDSINMDSWKDKPKLALKRETMERNLYDMIPDKVEAKKAVDTYLEPIKKSEADNIRSLNTMRDEVKKFNIKSGSTESELIQKYGEGKITLDEVKAKTKDWQKVEEATKYFRGKYDELLNTANEVLERNGYKPIPKRSNYFPHQGEVEGIMKALGLDSNELPTDINGLTAGFKPGKNFFGNFMERKGDETVFDAIRGFDNYIEGINRVIHHTDNIKRLRKLTKDIRKTYEGTTHLTNFVTELDEYTNLLAGKKSTLDRGMEELVGRRIYKVADAVRKQLGANMVGANISSALTNFIPLTQSLATTDKESFLRAMTSTIANVIKNDGFVDQSDYLVRRFGSDKLVTSAWQKPGQTLGWMFKVVDSFTSQVITRAKYLEGIKNGMPEQEALKEANNFAAKVMADRSIGQVPTLFTSKTLAPLTQFQLEVNNQISFLFKDMPQMYKGNKAALGSALAQVALYSYLFNNLYEKTTGRRPAFDVIGVVKEAIEDYNNDNIDNTEATKRTVENTANLLPFASFYTGGRIPLSNALPDFMGVLSGEKKMGEELIKPVINVALPTGGSQLNKSYKGISTVLNEGAYTDSDRLRYPVKKNTSNLIKGAVFGASALPETIDYYDNKRLPLGAEQTKKLEMARQQGKDVKPMYDRIIKDRKIENLKSQIANIRKDTSLRADQKQQQIQKLINEINKLK